eukprot:UN00578
MDIFVPFLLLQRFKFTDSFCIVHITRCRLDETAKAKGNSRSCCYVILLFNVISFAFVCVKFLTGSRCISQVSSQYLPTITLIDSTTI